jgi:glycosyltransferase involved in cell wall biosynthesis
MGNRVKTLLIETGGWGGVAHYSYNLLQALSKYKDFEVILLTDKEYELDGFAKDFETIKIPVKNRCYSKVIFKILVSIFRIKPSIIHIQWLLSPRKDWIFFLLARFLGMPIIYTVHNILPHEERESNALGLKQSLQIIYRTSRKLIVHSQSNMQELADRFKITPQKMNVIPHGNYLFIVPEQIITKDEAKRRLGLHMSDKIILFFGAIRRYKGIDYLIKAFKDVSDRMPHAKLLIVGKSMGVGELPPVDIYKVLIAELNLHDKVIFKPAYIPLSDIHKFFVASDVVVFPYVDTTESGSLQLAFAFSKPVIATRVGSFGEAIREGKNGFLVPSRNEKALSKAIIKFFSLDEKTRQEMGGYSRYIAETRYSWDMIANKTIGVYRLIL